MTRLAALLIAFALVAPLALPAEALELDRRRMLTAAEHKPWKGVGRVNIAAQSERSMCTGTLIAPDLVVTAAHCLYSDRTGRPHKPGNVHFVAGWRRGTKVAHRKAAALTIHPSYTHGSDLSFEKIGADLALIRLEEAIPVEVAPAFRVSADVRRDLEMTLISYRQDRAHALTRQEGCEINGARDSVLVLGCDVTFGASGSPVFAEIEGEPRVIAVISAKGQDRDTRRAIAFAVRAGSRLADLLEELN
ncbi:MAG: trypsin-like peptidase domain-containing protein [Pseudomonadota bacterium]